MAQANVDPGKATATDPATQLGMTSLQQWKTNIHNTLTQPHRALHHRPVGLYHTMSTKSVAKGTSNCSRIHTPDIRSPQQHPVSAYSWL